ncbi:MAG: hypothetical protein M3139_15490 [Bacteroidota bacterium]|nr:hypothetical protein [Bacteroidota bacterium]
MEKNISTIKINASRQKVWGSYVLIEESGQTRLEIIQEDNRLNAVQEELQGEENHILKSLKEVQVFPNNLSCTGILFDLQPINIPINSLQIL